MNCLADRSSSFWKVFRLTWQRKPKWNDDGGSVLAICQAQLNGYQNHSSSVFVVSLTYDEQNAEIDASFVSDTAPEDALKIETTMGHV